MKTMKNIRLFYFGILVFFFLGINNPVYGIIHPPAPTIDAPDDIDLGIGQDEQQGGGGLVGETIRVFNGNVVEKRSDLSFSSPNSLGLVFESFYNSRSQKSGIMGYGWTHTYEARLDPSDHTGGDPGLLKITDSTGRAHYFKSMPSEHEGFLGNDGEEKIIGPDDWADLQRVKDYKGRERYFRGSFSRGYEGMFAEKTYVEEGADGYIWHLLDGTMYGFEPSGRLSWIADGKGNRLLLKYDSRSRLQIVIDRSSQRVLEFHYQDIGLLAYVTGPITDAVIDGIWVSYGYDENNNLTSVTYADGSGFDYGYTDANDIHNLTEKRDKAGHLMNTWGYDESDRSVSNFSRDGKGVDIEYVSDSQIEVTDAYDKEREYLLVEVAGRMRVSAIIDGISGSGSMPYSIYNIISWLYDDNMNPEELEFPGGTINRFSDFDERGNPGIITLAADTNIERTIFVTYHPYRNSLLKMTEKSVLGNGNRVTIWDYDRDYNDTPNEHPTSFVSRIIQMGYTKNKSGSIVSYKYITILRYNDKGQVTSKDGPLPGTNDTTLWAYNPTTGDLLSIIRPLIGATKYPSDFYDAAGQAGKVIDVNGNSTTYTYDARGRIIGITNNADSSTSSMVYDIAGTLESKTNEIGKTTFEYEATYGRLYKKYFVDGHYTEFIYDEQGNVTGENNYDPNDMLTGGKSYLHVGSELPGKLYREINADGTYTQYNYDLDGNVASVTDPNGNITSYAYDPLGRHVTETQPESIVTSNTYDDHGNLHTITDAENRTTTYVYDDMASLVAAISPDTGTTTYAYDEAGNQTNKIDANGISVNYTYDTLNRLTYVDFPTDTDIAYTYDTGTNGIGHRTGMSDESGFYTFGYDGRGRVISKTSVIGGITYNLSRTYTIAGQVSSITYPDGRIVNYNREDCACKPDSITTTKDGITTTLFQDIQYNPPPPPEGISAMSNGAGGSVDSVIDTTGELTVSNPGAPNEKTYTYDNNGNLLTITAPSTPWDNRVYAYDALNRLTHAEGPWGSIDYTYDGVGNRLTETMDSGIDTYYNYYDGTNKLKEAVSDTDAVTYTYDLNGNVTGIGDKVLTYNQDNRLVSVASGGTTLGEYTYDDLGQRIIKKVNGKTTVFLYDFNGNIIGESDPSGTFSKEHIYFMDVYHTSLAMIDDETEEVYYYGNNMIGTPEIVTDSTNTVVWEAIYKPFGDANINTNSTITNNFRLPGQYYDQETGFHYNYHRYYEPSIGRYLRPDPIGLDGGVNLYVYVENNPLGSIDPLGLCDAYCEGGEWEGSSFFGLGGSYGGTAHLCRIFWSCKASYDVYCETSSICYGGGAIVGASIDLVGTATATGAYSSSALASDSSGWLLATPLYSMTHTSSGNTVIETTSAGLSAELGFAYITCYTHTSTCD